MIDRKAQFLWLVKPQDCPRDALGFDFDGMNDPAKLSSEVAAPAAVSRRQAFWYWFKLGFISFGGPVGQLDLGAPLPTRLELLHGIARPQAQQLATYIGWLMHGTWGGILAGALFVLPSLFILILLGWIYMAFGQVPAIAGVLYGMKPAVTAIVVFAAYQIGSRALKNEVLWSVAALAFIAIFVFDIPFPLIVLGAGFIGYIGGRVVPAKFAVGGGHQAVDKSFGPALIDDATPTPYHAKFHWRKLLGFSMLGTMIWAGTLGVLVVYNGWQGTLAQMGWFFTKAALLTFGGAYAVLPYVYQGAVEHYQWLTGAQMIDGLALGETTPGPLIMVVTFVGFVGAWTKSLFGPEALFLAGAAGATVATFFTFLPSFLFILIGGPLVESTHGDLKFTAPLTGITAAVVGVVVFFAYHVLWPQGFSGTFEWPSALIGTVAALALFRYQIGIIPVIGACGAIGLIYTLSKPLLI